MAIRKYRVREGFRYGANDKYKAGDIVELEESTARFEMDKLELAEIVHNVPSPPSLPSLRDEDSPGEPGKAPGDGKTADEAVDDDEESANIIGNTKDSHEAESASRAAKRGSKKSGD